MEEGFEDTGGFVVRTMVSVIFLSSYLERTLIGAQQMGSLHADSPHWRRRHLSKSLLTHTHVTLTTVSLFCE